MSVRVTCTDEQTGESDTCVVGDGDYLLIVVDPCYLHHTASYKGGRTHVLTVKDRTPRNVVGDEWPPPHNEHSDGGGL